MGACCKKQTAYDEDSKEQMKAVKTETEEKTERRLSETSDINFYKVTMSAVRNEIASGETTSGTSKEEPIMKIGFDFGISVVSQEKINNSDEKRGTSSDDMQEIGNLGEESSPTESDEMEMNKLDAISERSVEKTASANPTSTTTSKQKSVIPPTSLQTGTVHEKKTSNSILETEIEKKESLYSADAPVKGLLITSEDKKTERQIAIPEGKGSLNQCREDSNKKKNNAVGKRLEKDTKTSSSLTRTTQQDVHEKITKDEGRATPQVSDKKKLFPRMKKEFTSSSEKDQRSKKDDAQSTGKKLLHEKGEDKEIAKDLTIIHKKEPLSSTSKRVTISSEKLNKQRSEDTARIRTKGDGSSKKEHKGKRGDVSYSQASESNSAPGISSEQRKGSKNKKEKKVDESQKESESKKCIGINDIGFPCLSKPNTNEIDINPIAHDESIVEIPESMPDKKAISKDVSDEPGSKAGKKATSKDVSDKADKKATYKDASDKLGTKAGKKTTSKDVSDKSGPKGTETEDFREKINRIKKLPFPSLRHPRENFSEELFTSRYIFHTYIPQQRADELIESSKYATSTRVHKDKKFMVIESKSECICDFTALKERIAGRQGICCTLRGRSPKDIASLLNWIEFVDPMVIFYAILIQPLLPSCSVSFKGKETGMIIRRFTKPITY